MASAPELLDRKGAKWGHPQRNCMKNGHKIEKSPNQELHQAPRTSAALSPISLVGAAGELNPLVVKMEKMAW